jgi:signal transduction histidine kinase
MFRKVKVSHPERFDRKASSDIVRQFQVAMALMSVIPLLGFVYLMGRATGLEAFVGRRQGAVAVLIVLISLSGMLLARFLVSNVVRSLERANAELDKASLMKSSFLRNVAHEAATPLATARNHLEAMRDGLHGPLPQDTEKAVTVSLRQIQRLVRMVGDLLDIAKIEAGTLPLEFERTDLTRLLGEAAETAAEGVPDRRALIRVLADGSPRWVEAADPDRIVQVLVNLLRNAEKYSPEGSGAEVDVRDAGVFYEIAVRDRGDGVPEAMREKIFEPFVRSTQRRVGGVGLGLAITRHIVSAHGGRIWVEPNGDRGSAFLFTVPKKAPAGVRAPAHAA